MQRTSFKSHITPLLIVFGLVTKPVLVLFTDENTETTYMFPTEQFALEYLFPSGELCENKTHLILIIENVKNTELRLNGFPISKETQQHQIGKTTYSSLILKVEEQTQIVLRHFQTNVVFGASLVCSSHTGILFITLGPRMAPIAEVLAIIKSNIY